MKAIVLLGIPLVVNALPAKVLEDTSQLRDSYDYIVVGGGTSGLIVANRLTEDPEVSVLVIEAGAVINGEEEFNNILIPGNSNGNWASPRYKWNITGLPNAELNNRTTAVAVAKVVGGATAINGMVLDRGSRRDYDDWAEYVGDRSWGWDTMLHYMKKAETFAPPSKEIQDEFGITWDPEAHGTNGPLKSSYPDFIYPHVKYLIEAEKALGIPVPYDHGNGEAVGSYWTPSSIDPDGRTRSYTKNSYHAISSPRSNYHLLANHTVTKILFTGKRATGVEFAVGPSAPVKRLNTKKEIILAAGGVQSPKLLQLSGVGDQRLLKQHKIPVVVDLPGVGSNYQDHSGTQLQYNLTLALDPNDLNTNQTYRDEMLQLYLYNRTGPLTFPFAAHLSFYALPMITSDYATLLSSSRDKPADTYLPADTHPTVISGFAAQKEILLTSFATNESAVNENVFSYSSIQKPLSRGYVKIASHNPFAAPFVDWRTLSDPLDQQILVAGARFIRRLLSQPELAVLQPMEVAPGPTAQSDESILEWFRQNMTPSFYHPSCSCPMGPRKWGGVVDTKLRVYGIEGLRIVDASVMPMIPATHLQNTVYGIAEHAADIIKGKA